MSRTGLVTCLLFACALALPAPASSQLVWNNVCAPGGLCANFYVALDAYDPTGTVPRPFDPPYVGTTRLRLGVSNLQGVAGMPDPGAWLVQWLTVTGLFTDFDEGSVAGIGHYQGFTTVSAAGGNTRSYGGGAFGSAVAPGDAGAYEWGAHVDGSFYAHGSTGAAGVAGCDLPYGRGISTCGAGAFVETAHVLPGRWAYTDQVRLAFRGGAAGPTVSGLECNAGANCHAVPEPGSLMLLLGALGGLAFVRGRESFS